MRPRLFLLILLIPLILTLPLRAQQKIVAPTLRSAHADLKVSATTAISCPAKPFTREQVGGLVRDGLGDESGAKLIEQRGIDFAPSEDFIQTLKAAGASEAFVASLRAAVAPGLSPAHAALKGGSTTGGPPTSAKKPLNQVQVITLIAAQVSGHRVTMLVQQRGIDFEPTDDYLQEVRLAGGEDELISALKSAKVTKPATVDPAAQARQAEIRRHVARGAEFFKKDQYAEAEQEFRAAMLLDSQNGDLYVSLGVVMGRQKRWDDAAAAAREALRLNPNDAEAHFFLGFALGEKGDRDGEIAEYLEALRLDPNYADVHNNLGSAFGEKGDWNGEITEERQALRLNPNNDKAHLNLGMALGHKGDTAGAIAEYREALRLNPNNDVAHFFLGEAYNNLGVALEQKGDRQGALEEYRAAYMLDPKNPDYKRNYERLLQQVNQ